MSLGINKMSKVTVIVAIYNVKDYLDACLGSLMAQTYKDVEFVCVDDGSTDGSKAIIEKYVALDERFKYYYKENGGLADVRNFGIENSTSEYIMHMDGDDIADPKMVEAAVFYMDSFKLDMFIFGHCKVYPDGTKEVIHLEMENGIYNLRSNPEILAKTPNSSWGKIYRRELFERYDIRYPVGLHHEDLATTYRLIFYAKKIGYEDRALYDYAVGRVGNVTSTVDESIYDIIKVTDILLNFYRDHEAFDMYYDELECLIERNYIFALRKAMRIKDRTFGDKFIDAVYRSKGHYFKRKNKKYRIERSKDDFIYRHRSLTKMYYHHVLRKGKR